MNFPMVVSVTRMMQEGKTNNFIMAVLVNGGYTQKEIFGAFRKEDEHLIDDNDVITMNGSMSKYEWFDKRFNEVRQEIGIEI